MGKFEKGQAKPEDSGRKRGVRNKRTVVMKSLMEVANKESLLAPFVVEYHSSEQFREDVAALEPKDRLLFWEKCVSYLCPKPQSVDMKIREGDEGGGLLKLLDRLSADPRMTAEEKKE